VVAPAGRRHRLLHLQKQLVALGARQLVAKPIFPVLRAKLVLVLGLVLYPLVATVPHPSGVAVAMAQQ